MNKMIINRLLVTITVIAGLTIANQGCSRGDTTDSLSFDKDTNYLNNTVIHSSAVPVPDEFIGSWKSTEVCHLPDTYPHELTITRKDGSGGMLEITWDKRSTKPFNTGFKLIENDSDDISYQILTEVEYFEKRKRLVTGMIWKEMDEDEHGKNIAIMVKTYELTEDGNLIFEKYGYTTFEEDGALKFLKYAEFEPKNYHCVMSRK